MMLRKIFDRRNVDSPISQAIANMPGPQILILKRPPKLDPFSKDDSFQVKPISKRHKTN